MNNPKIEVVRGLPSPGDTTGESAVKFVFKPKFPGVRDKNSLLRLLEKHDLKTLGGIFLDDVQVSPAIKASCLKSSIVMKEKIKNYWERPPLL